MIEERRTVLVTGIAGPLGQALVRQLTGLQIVGTDFTPPDADTPGVFCRLDLRREESCLRLVEVLRTMHVSAVVHLQSISDAFDCERDPAGAWQTDVAGTARVLEAIAEVNRSGGGVRQFIATSSATVYGPGRSRPASEEARLLAQGWRWAVNKRESDEVAQFWAPSLGDCSTCILRPATCPHPSSPHYLLRLLRGTPVGSLETSSSKRRVPVVLPFGSGYLEASFQFVHPDDLARLMAWVLRRSQPTSPVTILNVAGQGEPVSLQQCLEIAGQRVFRVPGLRACRLALRAMDRTSFASLPEEGLAYLLAPPLMETTRLRAMLGHEYPDIIRHTMEEALREGFPRSLPEADTATLLAVR